MKIFQIGVRLENKRNKNYQKKLKQSKYSSFEIKSTKFEKNS